jgi:hypothetical protein
MMTFKKFLWLVDWLFMPKKLYGIPIVSDILGGGNPPPAPDYEAAAEATAAGDLENAIYATDVNRPDQITPWGSSIWTQGEDFDDTGYQAALDAYNTGISGEPPSQSDYMISGDDPFGQESGEYLDKAAYDKAMADYNAGLGLEAPNKEDFTTKNTDWTQTVNLTPEQQRLLDIQNQTGTRMGEIGLSGLDAAAGIFDTPLDLGDFEGAREEVKQAMLARVDKDIAIDRDTLHSSLIAKGIPEGSKAYQDAMMMIDRKQNDAYQQADIAATDQALKERQRTVQEALIQRQTPLNEINAFRSGNQVAMPQFNAFSNMQTTPGPDYLGATTAAGNYDIAGYNAEQAQSNAILGGLFGVGAAYAGK